MTEKPSFESSLQQLETIVAQLEQGELSLDDSLKKFEQGVQLARACQKTLTEAELKIKTISGAEATPKDE